MVFEVRDLWPELPIAIGALKGAMIPPAKWLERFAYRNSERIVALSPGMRDGVAKAGYPQEKISIIPNSSDIELFDIPESDGERFRHSFEWLQDHPLVVYTGTLGKINGVSYMAELAAKTWESAPEIRFLVVGNGAEEEMVRQKAQDLGVYLRNFFMMKPVAKQEMPAVLSAATVATSFVVDIPKLWANSANKFFDALASGTPIAINYQGWQEKLLRETEAGIILPAKNLDEAANKLVDFIYDPDRLNTAAQAARKLAETRFNRDHLAKKLETVLVDVVENFQRERKN